MHNLLRLAISGAALVALPLHAAPATAAWSTGLAPAQARAQAEKKFVLLFFHGSDWCPTCVEMEREVFKSGEFAEFAGKRLVLVDVDFPVKRKQEESLRQTNLALKARFNLSQQPNEGFPTVVLLDDEGHTVFQETGYFGGGAAAFLTKIQHHTGTGAAPALAGPYQNLSVEEFAKMAADKKNVILDVRTADEFRRGHIPGAVNLDFNSSDFPQKAGALDKSKTYLVHCATGVRSARACDKLAQLKFPKLYNLPGGFRAWSKAGEPVEK